MWKTWILTAWRNYSKYRFFSILNLAGLSLGMACLLAIVLYVRDEFQYDKFHENAARIYRVNAITDFGGQQTRYATTSTPLAEAIRSDIADVEEVARIFNRQATIRLTDEDSIAVRDKKYLENNFYFADPEVLRILSFSFINGNKASALVNPNQLVICRTIAEKYFGSAETALGKQVLFEDSIPLAVAAVFEDLPDQSSFPIEMLAHFENYFTIEPEGVRNFLKRDWMYNPVTCLILLRDNVSPGNVQKKIQELNARYADDRVQKSVSYEVQPLERIHLYSDISFSGSRDAIRNIYVFMAVGVLILMIACINFVNLATVHSLKRSKEIGIRKVMGATKHTITNQFLTESLLLVFFAMFMACTLVFVMLPHINAVSGKNFSVVTLASPEIAALIFLLFIITGIAAGLYPAFYIARFNPVASLKGLKNTSSNRSLLLRRILVTVQFSASVVLIITTLVIFQQMKFVREQPLGFQKEFMLTLPLFSYSINSVLGGGVEPTLRGRMNAFENELLTNPSIEAVTVSSVLPGQGAVPALIQTDEISGEDNVFVPVVSVDYDFLETYNMQLLAGRSFDRAAGTDHLEALIANEEAVRLLGFQNPADALGKTVEVLGKKAFIIGVIKNYNFEGLRQAFRPLLLEVNVSKFTTFSIRLNGKNIPQSIETVKKVWDTVFPEKVFEYEFLDTWLQQSYEREQQFGKLINFFSALAVFISSLGLFGLAAYIGHQKQKEAGIRKVLGASTAEVFYAQSKEFILLIVISVVVAMPLGYWLSNHWLASFAFRISLDAMPFLISFMLMTVVVFLTTAWQTYQTAKVNPADTLRSE
ncbi:MAG: ABC transporter permease [Cyclobacteriaceae bacterium]|nr:ABC transporter permease [Cyclobacteriaceae bacterium]